MAHVTYEEISSPKSRKTALLLCSVGGWCGLHQLYAGNFKDFAFYAVSLGGFGIGFIFDWFKILFGNFEDKNGFKLLNW